MKMTPKQFRKEWKQRTIQQNKALHLYFQHLADRLNEAGLDMRVVLKPEVDIPWSKDSVKEFLWRPIQRYMLLKKSTTELGSQDIDKVFETLNRHLAEKFGLSEPFPSLEEYANQYYEKETDSPDMGARGPRNREKAR